MTVKPIVDSKGTVIHVDDSVEFQGGVYSVKTLGPGKQLTLRSRGGIMVTIGEFVTRCRPLRPFIKWAGGKGQLLEQMSPYIPANYDGYVEPFVGGGALFFHLRPAKVMLCDINERLIRTYRAIRDDVDGVVQLLRSYPHSKSFFLDLRGRDIDVATDVEVAAWFIYLNKTGFNGLYRVNRKNKFNVPFGDQPNPTICDEENLRACSAALQGVVLEVRSFETVFAAVCFQPTPCFIYCDPPYVPVSVTSSFVGYAIDGFDMKRQKRLAELARDLKARGHMLLLSNSSAPAVEELYAGFELIPVSATRMVNSKATKRGPVKEYLIR